MVPRRIVALLFLVSLGMLSGCTIGNPQAGGEYILISNDGNSKIQVTITIINLRNGVVVINKTLVLASQEKVLIPDPAVNTHVSFRVKVTIANAVDVYQWSKATQLQQLKIHLQSSKITFTVGPPETPIITQE
ncbi:MAG: hypothetical protein ABEI06_08335 [Halobacteriaceae archaeon]